MDRGIRDADFGEEVEDPPLLPLLGAVVGVLLVGGSIAWFVLGPFVGVPYALSSPITPVLVGIVLFVASMLVWDPDIE